MAKLKFIDKQGQISVRLKLSSSERINNNEVMFFSKDFSRGFMRPNPEDSSKILFTGAKGVPLSRFLKRNINKDHFYMMIAQLLEAYKAVIHFKLHPAKVVLDLDFIMINENTGELFLIYQPVLNSPALNKGFMNCFSQIASAAKFADTQDRTSVNNFMAFAGRMPNFSVNELEKFIMGASPVTYTIVPRQTYGAQQSGVLNKPSVPQSASTASFQRPAQTAAPLAPEAPKVEEKKPEPVKEEKAPEAPKAEEKKSEPVKEEKAPESPKAEEKKPEPVKEEKAPEAPKAEEKKPEPVKEEKAPEAPKAEEKKPEPVKEEKAPEAPKVEEKKHGRKVVIKHVKVKAVSAKKNAEHQPIVEAPVEKAPEEPKVEEKKSEPVKEEKAPEKVMETVAEIPEKVEKKPEPVKKEEPKPVMETAPEKPSFSYAEQFGAEDEGTVVLNDYSRSTMADLPTAKLIRRSNKETAIITKHVFTIGKERARVDYCVTNNRTVSRFHATIYRRTDGYYVVDNNSTNRTFVNGSPIPVQTEIRLRNGDILRLSNEEFDFIEE